MGKATDQEVEIPLDSKVQVPDDWNPDSILSQKDAERWAKKFTGIVYVTSDKNVFTQENIEYGKNHVINTGVKGFNV